MIRNLKALGPALAVAFAVAAVAASAASAQQGFLTSDGPMTSTGVETGGASSNAITAFGLTAQCPGSIGTGHRYDTTPHAPIPSGATSFTLTPHLNEKNCVISGLGWPLTADFNGCDYVTHLGVTTGGENTYGGTADVVCPPGKEIVWTAFTPGASHTTPVCVIHIPGQTGLTGAHATDTTNGHIDITGTLEGIDVTRTKSATHPILCPESTTTNAKFDLDGTISGRNGLGEPTAVGLSHN